MLYACRDREVPEGDDWLGPHERAVQAHISRSPRRSAWRRGRWAAKQALWQALPGPALSELQILAAADGAPEPYCGGERLACPLSLAHSGDRAIAYLERPGLRVGCDIERVTPRSRAFLADFFLPSEQAWIESASLEEGAERVNLLWSAKECGLKALREGLRRDTRSVEVTTSGTDALGWRGLRVSDQQSTAVFVGWWRRWDEFVITLVSEPPVPAPAWSAL